MILRCPHLYNVMRWKGIDCSKMTPKRRTISTRLKNQRLQKRTPGWKAPGQFDRASEDTQIRDDTRLQRIREELRTTPSAATLLQSAGLVTICFNNFHIYLDFNSATCRGGRAGDRDRSGPWSNPPSSPPAQDSRSGSGNYVNPSRAPAAR